MDQNKFDTIRLKEYISYDEDFFKNKIEKNEIFTESIFTKNDLTRFNFINSTNLSIYDYNDLNYNFLNKMNSIIKNKEYTIQLNNYNYIIKIEVNNNKIFNVYVSEDDFVISTNEDLNNVLFFVFSGFIGHLFPSSFNNTEDLILQNIKEFSNCLIIKTKHSSFFCYECVLRHFKKDKFNFKCFMTQEQVTCLLKDYYSWFDNKVQELSPKFIEVYYECLKEDCDCALVLYTTDFKDIIHHLDFVPLNKLDDYRNNIEHLIYFNYGITRIDVFKRQKEYFPPESILLSNRHDMIYNLFNCILDTYYLEQQNMYKKNILNYMFIDLDELESAYLNDCYYNDMFSLDCHIIYDNSFK